MHMHSLRGSPYWLAPEAIRGVGAGRKADVWALGGVLLETSPASAPNPNPNPNPNTRRAARDAYWATAVVRGAP